MKLSCSLPPSLNLIKQAQLAESLGYERVWVGDSPALYSDPWVALSQVAANTSKIGLGIAVLVPSTRHVMVNAAAICGIEAQAPGRLAVAIGTGFTARRLFGKGPMSWASTADYIRQLKALLNGETIVLDGAKTKLMHPAGMSAPLPLKTPILVAANGPKGIEVAKEIGDGVMSVQAPIGGFDWSVLLQPGTVLEDGETLDCERVFEAVGPAVATFYHGAYEAMGEGVDGFPNGAAWRAMIESFPKDEQHLYLHQEHCVGVNEHDRPHLDVANMAPLTFTGTVDELKQKAADLEAAGLSELLYMPLGPDIERELKTMAAVFS